MDEEARRRILACIKLSQLKLWLRKAVTVKSVQELFEPGSASKPTVRKASKPGRSSHARRKPRSR